MRIAQSEPARVEDPVTYTVLARRYRSREFDELVGQEPIARTLKNAIAAGRTAHAYLFCGTRGVGKTSLARIFAKALNVTPDLGQGSEIAEAILRGDDLDVIEIDGASNRGIQEARDLIAGAGLSPARCRYKIYIIDEVHMLTREAFNALLKTMEEPPAHVKFILCTTDPQKVPATVQSRCQRFDFRAIPTPLIARQLRAILDAEGLEADDALVHQVARLGNGSMRDALSLLDRLIAGGDERLTLERAAEMLGLPDQSLAVQLADAIVAADPQAALETGAELLARGATVEQALELLTDHFRNLMVVAAGGAGEAVLDLAPEALEIAKRQAAHFDVPALVHLIALADATARNARGSATARSLFDAVIVRMCLSEHLADIASLLAGAGPAAERSGPAAKKKEERPAEQPGPAPQEDPRRAVSAAPVAVADTDTDAVADADTVADADADTDADPDPVADTRAVAHTPAPPTLSDPDGRLFWEDALARAALTPRDEAKVAHLRPRSFDGRTLRLEVDEEGAASARFLRTQADSVAELIRGATGRAVRVLIEAPDHADRGRAPAAGFAEVRDIPAVRKAMEIFDAVVTEVRDAAPDEAGGATPAPTGGEPTDV